MIVSTQPPQIIHNITYISIEKWQISDCLVASNICQTALMRIVEWAEFGDLVDLLYDSFECLGWSVVVGTKGVQFRFVLALLGELLELLGEICALLGGYLGRGSI